MSATLICPKCGYSNNPSAKFCSQCATSLVEKTKPCYNCGAPNNFSAVFCQNCATKFIDVLPGLSIQRAKEWKEIFEQLGWFNKNYNLNETIINKYKEYFKEKQIELFPNNIETEPILLPIIYMSSSRMSPLRTISQNNIKVTAHYLPLLLATRCRIRSITSTSKVGWTSAHFTDVKITDFWYKDLSYYKWEVNGKELIMQIQNTQGNSLVWAAELPKLSFLHLANLLLSNDTISRYKSDQILTKQGDDRGEIAALIGKFLEEISEVASQA